MRRSGNIQHKFLYPGGLLTFLLWSFFVVPLCCQAQTGKVSIVQDSRIPKLIEKHIALNKAQEGVMDGYRVQIYFDSGAESKKRAMETRTDFLSKFPGIPAYLAFSEPFFKIRVGDFRKKIEADGLLHKVITIYPNAFIVRDKINFPKID